MIFYIMLDDNKAWIWWKRYGEHLTAPLILFALIFLGFMYYEDQQLKEEISLNCGWGEEDYHCYCVKDLYWDMKNKYEGTIDISNLSFSGDNNDTLD